MGTRMREPPELIPGARGLERLSKGVLRPPSRGSTAAPRPDSPAGDDFAPVRLHLLHHTSASLGDPFPERRHLHVPRLLSSAPLPQRRIPLPNRPTVPSPPVRELRFHVEHSPVEPAPPSPPALFDELVNLRINDLHRKDPGEIRQRRHGRGVNASLRYPPAGGPRPQGHGPASALKSRSGSFRTLQAAPVHGEPGAQNFWYETIVLDPDRTCPRAIEVLPEPFPPQTRLRPGCSESRPFDAAEIANGELAEDHGVIVTLGARGLTCKGICGGRASTVARPPGRSLVHVAPSELPIQSGSV